LKPDTKQIEDLYNRLVAINQEAFDGELYNIAYHALRAAFHCAEEIEPDTLVIEVGRLAEEQNRLIDSNHPEYEPSTKRAQALGQQVSIFTTTSMEAKSLLTMRKTN
jgi:hypothetical protein